MQKRAVRVLVIEDDRAMATMTQRMLELEGYTAEIATAGADGLARIAAGGVDVVLLDIMMPDLDGVEVCRRVRMDEGQGYIPIILLTGLTTEAAQQAGFAAGADDFITKPFRREDLLARVHVWVQARHRLERARAEVQGLATRVLHEQEQLQALTERLTAVVQQMATGAKTAKDAARWREELDAITAALAARVATLPLRT
jgi:DNA-binding response OmpR family regulator